MKQAVRTLLALTAEGVIAPFSSMCGPNFCPVKITLDVRGYVAVQGLANVDDALKPGMQEKTGEFRNQGSEFYFRE